MPLKTATPVDGSLVAKFHGRSLKNDKDKLQDSSALVCLSIIGNERCKGAHLDAIIKEALLQFKDVTFLIGDETYWHNLKSEITVTEETKIKLKQEAIALGDDYLQTHLSLFLNAIKMDNPRFNVDQFLTENSLKPVDEQIAALNKRAQGHNTPFKILRWRDWVNSDQHDYQAKKRELEELYESENCLKDALEPSIKDYVRRHHRKETEAHLLNLSRNRSADYLREETPAIFWIAGALGINYIAYPGKNVPLFTATHSFFITNSNLLDASSLRIKTPEPVNIAVWLEIKFKPLKPSHEALLEIKQSDEESNKSSPNSVSNLIKFFEKNHANAQKNQIHSFSTKSKTTAQTSPASELCSLESPDSKNHATLTDSQSTESPRVVQSLINTMRGFIDRPRTLTANQQATLKDQIKCLDQLLQKNNLNTSRSSI